VALSLLGCRRPPETPLRLAPIGMHPRGEYTATPDGAVTFAGNGKLDLDLYLRRGPLTITVVGRGDGTATLGVGVDDHLLGTVLLDAGREASVQGTIERSGMHSLWLAASPRAPGATPALRLERILVGSRG
jgi:hypothetical protein